MIFIFYALLIALFIFAPENQAFTRASNHLPAIRWKASSSPVLGDSFWSILLKNSFLGGEEKFLACVTSFNNFYTRGYIKNLNSRYRSSHRLLCRDWIESL